MDQLAFGDGDVDIFDVVTIAANCARRRMWVIANCPWVNCSRRRQNKKEGGSWGKVLSNPKPNQQKHTDALAQALPHLSILGTHSHLEKFIGLCECYLRGVEEVFPQWRNELMQALVYRIRLNAEEVLYCQYCGTRNELTSVFCRKCRRKLTPQRKGFAH